MNNIVVSHYREGGIWKYDYFQIGKKKVAKSLRNRIQKKTLTYYYNIAYYLQKANANEEAIYLLEKILEKYPNRTVAHYNIADAYWAIDNKKKAKEHYNIYIKQMKAKGKEKSISKVVKLRLLGK